MRSGAAIGVTDTDQLLERAATTGLWKKLARQSRVTKENLVYWAGLADLVQVKRIGPRLAERLVYSGAVGNVQEMREAAQNLDHLQAQLKAYLNQLEGRPQVPSKTQC